MVTMMKTMIIDHDGGNEAMAEVMMVMVASVVICPGPLHQTLSFSKINPMAPGSVELILHIG